MLLLLFKITFIENLLYAKNLDKYFTYVNPFNLHETMMQIVFAFYSREKSITISQN